MSSLLSLLGTYVFAGIPSNAAYDAVKVAIAQVQQRSWAELFLDAFQQAVEQERPRLAQHARSGEVMLDRQELERVLQTDLNVYLPVATLSTLTNDGFAERLAAAMEARSVLQIGDNNLSQADYVQLIRNVIGRAQTMFVQIVLSNEGAFRRALLESGEMTRESVDQFIRSQGEIREQMNQLILLYQTNHPPEQARSLVERLETEPRRRGVQFVMDQAERRPLLPLRSTNTAVIRKIEAILGVRVHQLNELEAWVLLVAVCVPHLLEQPIDSTAQPVTRAQLEQLVDRLAQDPMAPPELSQLIFDTTSDIVAIANARHDFDPADSSYLDGNVGGFRIRRQLLAASFHLSTVINLDQYVDPTPPAALPLATPDEQIHWWRQAYISGVSIEDQRLTLHFHLPPGYEDLYRPILIDPLAETLQALVQDYNDVFHAIGVALIVQKPVVRVEDVSPVPADFWPTLKRKIETEQAHKVQHRLHQDVLRTARQRELLVRAEAGQAEQMAAEGRHREAAERFANAAALLARAHAIYGAEDYATRAARQYEQSGDLPAAADAHLQAATFMLERALTPTLARPAVERAQKIISTLDNPALRTKWLLAEAQLEFAMLQDDQTKERLDQARQSLLQVPSEDVRLPLLQTYALQHAIFAMVWEEWDTAQRVLDTALADCPEVAYDVRVVLLTQLLLLHTERGNWEAADQVYQAARQQLVLKANDRAAAVLAMHYAGSLARRGHLDEAYTHFNGAIEQLEDTGEFWVSAVAYQNMQHLLTRNGARWFSDFEHHQQRRIDLFIQTKAEDAAYAHEVAAASDILADAHRGALVHLRHALAYAWPVGAWLSIEQAYGRLAMLCAATGRPVEAVLNAVRASNLDSTEQYSIVLRDQGNEEQLMHLVDELIKLYPTISEQAAVAKALGVLADVIPVSRRDHVRDRLISLLDTPEGNKADRTLLKQTVDALRELVPQFTSDETTQLLRSVLNHLQQPHAWQVIQVLLRLVRHCFYTASVNIDLFAPTVDLLLDQASTPVFENDVNAALVAVACCAPTDVRERIVAHLRLQPDQQSQLAFLGDRLPDDQLRPVIERVLRNMNLEPVIIEENGVRMERTYMTSVNPRSLNNYNRVLPPSLYNTVIDGLLAAIVNQHNDLGMRSQAIWALGDLPTAIIIDRADEILDYLLWGAEGSLPRSMMVDWELESQTNPFSNARFNMGNVEQLRRISLFALGRVYEFVTQGNRERIDRVLIEASRDSSAEVRQGVAQALDAIEGVPTLAPRVLRRLLVLLHDAAIVPRGWACRAAGKVMADGRAGDYAEDMLDELLVLAATSPAVDVRAGVAVGLRRMTSSTGLDQQTPDRVDTALATLGNDLSFKVRRAATAETG